jgi:hypothetical protein
LPAEQTLYLYRSPICRACNEAIETQQHIITCTACPLQNKIRNKYIVDLSMYLENQRTNNDTKIIILQKVQSLLNVTDCETFNNIIPDATNTLKAAVQEQDAIGWDHWLKGRISQEWVSLINYDIATIDTGTKYNSSEKWATGIIDLNWDLVQNLWFERNKIEHDSEGNPDLRVRENLIEYIQGESALMNYTLYKVEDMITEALITLPVKILLMIEATIKKCKSTKRKRKNGNMQI